MDSNRIVKTMREIIHHVANSKSRSGMEKMVEVEGEEERGVTGQLGVTVELRGGREVMMRVEGRDGRKL